MLPVLTVVLVLATMAAQLPTEAEEDPGGINGVVPHALPTARGDDPPQEDCDCEAAGLLPTHEAMRGEDGAALLCSGQAAHSAGGCVDRGASLLREMLRNSSLRWLRLRLMAATELSMPYCCWHWCGCDAAPDDDGGS